MVVGLVPCVPADAAQTNRTEAMQCERAERAGPERERADIKPAHSHPPRNTCQCRVVCRSPHRSDFSLWVYLFVLKKQHFCEFFKDKTKLTPDAHRL
jgi:hypothetical protein